MTKRWRTLRIPSKVLEEIEEFLETPEGQQFHTKSDFVKYSLRKHLEFDVDEKEAEPHHHKNEKYVFTAKDEVFERLKKYAKKQRLTVDEFVAEKISKILFKLDRKESLKKIEEKVESAISLQKTMADKLGTNTKVPEKSLNIATAFAEQTTKAWNFQNQLMLTSLETLSKNIQAFDDTSKNFAELNGKLISSWASIIKQKSRE